MSIWLFKWIWQFFRWKGEQKNCLRTATKHKDTIKGTKSKVGSSSSVYSPTGVSHVWAPSLFFTTDNSHIGIRSEQNQTPEKIPSFSNISEAPTLLCANLQHAFWIKGTLIISDHNVANSKGHEPSVTRHSHHPLHL